MFQLQCGEDLPVGTLRWLKHYPDQRLCSTSQLPLLACKAAETDLRAIYCLLSGQSQAEPAFASPNSGQNPALRYLLPRHTDKGKDRWPSSPSYHMTHISRAIPIYSSECLRHEASWA